MEKKSRLNHSQASTSSPPAKRLAVPKNVMISLDESDVRLIRACIRISQLKRPADLTYRQDVAGSVLYDRLTALLPANSDVRSWN